MKKILLFLCIIIFTPLIIINIFVKINNLRLKSVSNVFIRVKTKNNDIIKINIDDYIIGVLAGEMPINFEKEALKAQAVASRSYVYNKIDINKEYDVVDNVNNQVYKGYDYLKSVWKENYENNISLLKEVVMETKNEYIFYNGEIIDAFFFSTSNGMTENAKDVFGFSQPYLESVKSKWDEDSPNYYSKKSFDKYTFLETLKINTFKINNIEKNKSGSIKTIMIDNKKISGTEFRKTFDLKSTYFNIYQDNNNIVIENKGYGHGVGMSQYGAQNMAKNGYTYDEILKYYYKNTKILKK